MVEPARVATFAKCRNIDRTEQLVRFGEARQQVLEVLRVDQLREHVDHRGLRRARRPDDHHVLAGDRRDRHQADDLLLVEELRAHLLEYKLAKEIARYLRQREEAGLQTHPRSGLLAGIETQLTWSPPTLIGLEVDMLAQAFQRILELRARDEAASATLLPLARVRVSERIAEIVGILRLRPHLLLAELLENETSRLVIIVTFLAVLELWKHARISVAQTSLFSPITLERGELWEQNGEISVEDEY